MPTIHVLMKQGHRRDATRRTRSSSCSMCCSRRRRSCTRSVAASRHLARAQPRRCHAHRRAHRPCVLAGEYLADRLDDFARRRRSPWRGAARGQPSSSTARRTAHPRLRRCRRARARTSGACSTVRRSPRMSRASIPIRPRSVIVCSGSVDRFNLEDFYGAGHLVERLCEQGEYALSDSGAGRAARTSRQRRAERVACVARRPAHAQRATCDDEVAYASATDIARRGTGACAWPPALSAHA